MRQVATWCRSGALLCPTCTQPTAHHAQRAHGLGAMAAPGATESDAARVAEGPDTAVTRVRVGQPRQRFSSSELDTTDTLERAIAAPETSGAMMPRHASGMSRQL